jgi:hypothetical protein
VDQAIRTLARQLERGELKASAADLVRLLQFRSESTGSPHQAMTVRWVDECQKTASEE